MNQVEELCDRVLMIDHGSAVLYDSMQEIRTKFRKKTLMVDVDGELPAVPGVVDTVLHRDATELVLAPDTTPQQVLDQLRERGAAINRFEIYRRDGSEPELRTGFHELGRSFRILKIL